MKLTSRDMPRSYWRKVAKRNGIATSTFYYRLASGWTDEKAATQTPQGRPA